MAGSNECIPFFMFGLTKYWRNWDGIKKSIIIIFILLQKNIKYLFKNTKKYVRLQKYLTFVNSIILTCSSSILVFFLFFHNSNLCYILINSNLLVYFIIIENDIILIFIKIWIILKYVKIRKI